MTVKKSMTDMESMAVKVGRYWVEFSRKIFPDYRHEKGFPVRGDPRNTLLFRHCYKFVRKTYGEMTESEYRDYILSQLVSIKNIPDGLVTPALLNGERAWECWRRWRQKKGVAYSSREASPDFKIKARLVKDRELLVSRLGRHDEEVFKKYAEDIGRWATTGMVSDFYVALSPWFKKYCESRADLPVVGESQVVSFREVFPEES